MMHQNRKQRKMLRKRRRNTFLFILLLLCLVALQMKPTVLEAHTPTQYIAVIVEDGDSLWGIAQRFTNNQLDIRQYINLIQEHNQMDTANIYPGEVLKIPLYSGN
jgi:hypothetical protein